MSNFVELQFNQKILKGGTAPAINPSFNTPVASGVAVINPSISTPVAINPSFNTAPVINPSISTPVAINPSISTGVAAINPYILHTHQHSHANGEEPHEHNFH